MKTALVTMRADTTAIRSGHRHRLQNVFLGLFEPGALEGEESFFPGWSSGCSAGEGSRVELSSVTGAADCSTLWETDEDAVSGGGEVGSEAAASSIDSPFSTDSGASDAAD